MGVPEARAGRPPTPVRRRPDAADPGRPLPSAPPPRPAPARAPASRASAATEPSADPASTQPAGSTYPAAPTPPARPSTARPSRVRGGVGALRARAGARRGGGGSRSARRRVARVRDPTRGPGDRFTPAPELKDHGARCPRNETKFFFFKEGQGYRWDAVQCTLTLGLTVFPYNFTFFSDPLLTKY